MVVNVVEFSDAVVKAMPKLPPQVAVKLRLWAGAVRAAGIDQVRKQQHGYRDKPLSGDRKGQHSIRLNRAYRAFYTVVRNEVTVVRVIEVNKHEY
ncbi:MAG TPA: hypothetical protein VGO53_16150 [Steroidobacteraceae bacterium]|jgi:proteic killer suppression protein|nr:hypothetical protein [Steroidobacteraceae bacterium]